MRIENELKLDFDDVLIRPKRSTLPSRSKVDLNRTYTTLNSQQEWSGVSLVAANMDTVGSMNMARALSKHDCCVALHKHYDNNSISGFARSGISSSRYFITIGSSQIEFMRLQTVVDDIREYIKDYNPMINVDVANGYMYDFHQLVKKVRKSFPKSIIMAGNVATSEMTQQLLECGADIVKCGIGSGSVCETRIKAGVGYPQLSSVLECADAAHGYGGLICSDGGCKTAGDVAKAFGAGADFVMIGGMLAGTDECEGEWEYTEDLIPIDEKSRIQKTSDSGFSVYHEIETKARSETLSREKKSFKFYGMSSKEAQNKYNGGLADHRSSEGKCVTIPAKGPAEEVIKDILGGVRSACTYVGAEKLKDLSKCTTFVRCSNTHNKVFS